MNKYFPYPIKKKSYSVVIVLNIIILIGISCILYIDHVTKSFFPEQTFTTSSSEILKHKFNPKETEIEIVQDGDGVRIKTPEEIIREVAKEENFKDVDYLISLSACESSLGERMINTKGNKPEGSKDLGWYQINNYWHSEVKEECAYDLRCSTKWVIGMIKAGKKNQWVCNQYIK